MESKGSLEDLETLSLLCETSFIFFLRFYLFTHERDREAETQREKQAPHRKPDAGLDPGTRLMP